MSSKIPITIIGAGITGLASAYQLSHSSSAEYEITIIARDLPGDLTTTWSSPWAGAIFQPIATLDPTHQAMQIASFTFYRDLARSLPSTETGVKFYPTTEYFDAESTSSASRDASNAFIRGLVPDFAEIPAAELPTTTGVTSGIRYTSMAINPNYFLPWLQRQLEAKGVRFIRSEVESLEGGRELSARPPVVIVNASGLGARQLAGDESVIPVRGQTMFVRSDYERLMIREGSEYTYVIPRPNSGGVVIGGVKQPGRTDAKAERDIKEDILRRVNALVGGAFDDLKLDSEGKNERVQDIVGFRPGREEGMRVEKDVRLPQTPNSEVLRIVHAYGVGGAGYIFSFGVAKRVEELVAELLEGQ